MYKLNRYTQSEREWKTHAKGKKSNTERRDYIKQFINVTFMQGTWNINPNQDQFTSNVRPSTCLVRKENKAYRSEERRVGKECA